MHVHFPFHNAILLIYLLSNIELIFINIFRLRCCPAAEVSLIIIIQQSSNVILLVIGSQQLRWGQIWVCVSDKPHFSGPSCTGFLRNHRDGQFSSLLALEMLSSVARLALLHTIWFVCFNFNRSRCISIFQRKETFHSLSACLPKFSFLCGILLRVLFC